MLKKASLEIVTATEVPMMAPITVMVAINFVCVVCKGLKLEKPFKLAIDWKRMPTLLVPLAILPGRPIISVSKESVITDPFPAIVLMTPAVKLPRNAINI